ncbi:MAG: dTDP-4-amino-4,6-dideoxygalactose transaminase [Bacteroidota bacterium]
MAMIPFNIPHVSGEEQGYVVDAIARNQLAGGGFYTQKVEEWLCQYTGATKTLLTSSCTHALEMCALLCDIQPGDEVILSSFNFVSAANAFALRGARIVFVDIRPDTMNVDEQLLESAITPRTKAIVIMHYAGIACEMETISKIAEKHQLWLIEDAAHCMDAYYKDQHLGTIGHLGALSFHATKNIQCGEGGALLINDPRLAKRAEIIREKGTNRSSFIRGEVDKYSWVDLGSSYLMSELGAAYLYGQLQSLQQVTKRRMELWSTYQSTLHPIAALQTPNIPEHCRPNGHIFYLLCQSPKKQQELLHYLKQQGIQAYFHYVALHQSTLTNVAIQFFGADRYTSTLSNCLVRLPIYTQLSTERLQYILRAITHFYEPHFENAQ